MSYFELLHTVAGVAVTLIGFSGIVVVTERRPGTGWTALDRVVFYSMLAPSLTALFCAFVPEVLSTVIERPDNIWRVANGVLGTAHLVNIVPVLAKFRTVKFTVLQRVFLTSGVLAIIAHFTAAAGVIAWVELVFLIGLIQQLMVGMFNFLQLVQADTPGGAAQAAAAERPTSEDTLPPEQRGMPAAVAQPVAASQPPASPHLSSAT